MTYTEESMAAAICRSIFDPTRYSCIMNVSYGFLNHEADLLILNPSRRLYEIEIKTTLADLKADFKKTHQHADAKIERLYYAVPDKLLEAASNLIPDQYGLISVKAKKHPIYSFLVAERVRAAEKLRDFKLDDMQTIQLLRLGTMRFWTRKRHEFGEMIDEPAPTQKEIQLELFS